MSADGWTYPLKVSDCPPQRTPMIFQQWNQTLFLNGVNLRGNNNREWFFFPPKGIIELLCQLFELKFGNLRLEDKGIESFGGSSSNQEHHIVFSTNSSPSMDMKVSFLTSTRGEDSKGSSRLVEWTSSWTRASRRSVRIIIHIKIGLSQDIIDVDLHSHVFESYVH